MRIPISTIRRILSGLAIALVASVATVAGASQNCPAITTCAEGTALFGFDIECDCMTDGFCSVLTVGHLIRCECENFPTFTCDCENGCP